jgi:hypothetical protein
LPPLRNLRDACCLLLSLLCLSLLALPPLLQLRGLAPLGRLFLPLLLLLLLRQRLDLLLGGSSSAARAVVLAIIAAPEKVVLDRSSSGGFAGRGRVCPDNLLQPCAECDRVAPPRRLFAPLVARSA